MNDDRSRPPSRSRPHRGQRRDTEPRPIDAEKLQALALHYAARYATTAAKLRQYLKRKLRERPWQGAEAPDPEALIARLVGLGYVNDAAWATMKQREMSARGLGQRRIAQALQAAGVSSHTGDTGDEPASPLSSAIHFARRKRLGPFARSGPAGDPAQHRRALAAMMRAGHAFDVARRVLAAPDPDAAEALADE